MENIEIKARIILEVLGSPEEHVKKILSDVLAELDKKELEILEKETSKVKKVEKFFSGFAEVEFKCKGLEKLLDVCFDFMPSVVEIVEPKEFKFDSKVLEGFLNDLLAKLHKNSMVMRNLHAENVMLKKEKEVKN
jgi:translation elongation factor EF-G